MSAFKTNEELIAEHAALTKGLRNPAEATLPDGRSVQQANADFLAAEAAHAEELRLQRVAVREAREAEQAQLAEVASSDGSAASATEDVPSAKSSRK